nr:Arfrp1 [Vischeria sp. CAUP Q 202]
MFSLLAGLLRYFFSKTEVHVLILGLDHAGKTTLLEQSKGIFRKISGIPPEKITPTVGLNVGKMDIESCFVILWDLGGQVRMRSIWDKYYSDAHGVIFVLDAADVARFEEAKLAFASIVEHDALHGVPVLLFANKQDLPGALSSDDIAASLEVGKVQNHRTRVQPCSALTCDGIENGVRWLVLEAKRLAKRLD